MLFADWCAATGRSSLPADPATLVAFLDELPAGPATIARRVRAVDAAHRAAGLPAPGGGQALDEVLGRRPASPRFAADLVARALEAIPVGGWPVGIVGRRDAAIVALICSAGLTRAQVQALRTGTGHSAPHGQRSAQGGQWVREPGEPSALVVSMTRTDAAGSCSSCALSRWLRVVSQLDRMGWRSVRAELADLGDVAAGAESAHDCAQPFAGPAGGGREGAPLFCAIDRRGAPEIGYPLSTRSITAIVVNRLSLSGPTRREGRWDAEDDAATARAGRHEWSAEDRRRGAQRFAEIEAVLDEMEEGAEAIMAKVRAAMGDELEGRQRRT